MDFLPKTDDRVQPPKKSCCFFQLLRWENEKPDLPTSSSEKIQSIISQWKRDLIQSIGSVFSCIFRIMLLVIHSNCVVPIFQGGDLFMKKRPHKSHWYSDYVQISEFVACNPFKLCGPRFPRGDLCVIMEKRPHKTHYLTGFVQISKFVACNPFKLCGPHFPRWWFVYGKATS